MNENNDFLNLNEDDEIITNDNINGTTQEVETNKPTENQEVENTNIEKTPDLAETIAETTQQLTEIQEKQTTETDQIQNENNEKDNENKTETPNQLQDTIDVMPNILLNNSENIDNANQNTEDKKNEDIEPENIENTEMNQEEADKNTEVTEKEPENPVLLDSNEPNNTEQVPEDTENEEAKKTEEEENTQEQLPTNSIQEVGQSIQNALLGEPENEPPPENVTQELPTDENAKEYVYDSDILSIPAGLNVHGLFSPNHVVNLFILPNQTEPTRILFSVTTDTKVFYNYCKYLKLSNVSTFHFSTEPTDDGGQEEFFSLCTGRDLITLLNPNEEQIEVALKSLKQSYIIPCSPEDDDKLKSYSNIDPIERYSSKSMIEYVNGQISQNKETLSMELFEYERPITYSSFLKISIDSFLGFEISYSNDECEQITKPSIEYTHNHDKLSIFDPTFEPNRLLGINNVQEIELAPNKYVKCLFSATEDKVLEKFLSLCQFDKSISYHFSSSPNGHVNYFTLCTGEALISLVNPSQKQLNIVFSKVKNLYAIPCGLNDKSQLFFYDYLNKMQRIASDRDVSLISEEIKAVQDSFYCKKYEYDIASSYGKFLYVAYQTFIGYLVRSQFLETVQQPLEIKSFDVKDFITLRRLDYGKKLALYWPEGKVFVLKQYRDLFKFNQSLYLYKENKMSCIIPFYGEARNNENYLVFGLGSRGTLKEVVSNEYLNIEKCRKISIQLVFILAYLHMTHTKPCSISDSNISIDWEYNAYLADFDNIEKVINLTPEEYDIRSLGNVLHTLVSGQSSSYSSSISNKWISSIYEPIARLFELCKKPETKACDLVAEVLSDKCFSREEKLIDSLLEELPHQFDSIEAFENCTFKYFKFNCREIDESHYNFIKTLKFGTTATIQFIPNDEDDEQEPNRIFVFETNKICGMFKNVQPKVVNLIASKMRRCTVAAVSDRDLDVFFEYYNFDLIQNFVREPQLSVYRTNAKQALDEMNDFDDKFIVEETLSLSYAIAHPAKYKVKMEDFLPPPQFPQASLIKEDFNIKNEIPMNQLRLVEVLNNFNLSCLYSTDEDYTFNEFIRGFNGNDKFVVVHFSKDTKEFVSFCTNKKLLLLPAKTNDGQVNNQVNKVINVIKSKKVYGSNPNDRSELFGFTNFDLIENFANQDEMEELAKKVEAANEDLLPKTLNFDKPPMNYSTFFKHAGSCVTAYYLLLNPKYDQPTPSLSKLKEQSIMIGEPDSFEKIIDNSANKTETQTFADFESEEDLKKAFNLYTLAAERNDPAALFNLGLMYSTGQGVEQDKDKAADFYKRSADLGNAKAQYNLGLMYYKGESVEEDKQEAARLYQLAADQGIAKAQSNLGLMYSKGDGIEQNYEKAVELYEKAVAQNDPDAQLNLGMMCDIGQGTPVDKERTVDLYTKSAENGNAKAQFNLGVMYHNGVPGILQKDNKKAIKYYSMSSSKGLAKAQFNLGVLYNKGDDDVPVDKKMAAQLLQLAADQGDSDAQLNLGAMYARGDGVPKDKNKTFELYKMAAKQGNPKAQFNLAVLYSKGEGTERNYRKAEKYYLKASQQDIPQAAFNLGVLYFRGVEGIEVDKAKACELFEKTVSLNPKNSKALFNLAIMYMKGEGVEQDDQKALYYFKEAANLNNKDALLNLGMMYLEGSGGVERNKKQALEYYKRAADLNSDKAQLNLGLMYQNGDGCEVDIEKAKEYFELAANQGNTQAQINLGLLLIGGTVDDQNQAKRVLQEHAEQGNVDAMYGLARKYQQDDDMESAIKWYSKAAAEENSQAQLELGKIYLKGDETDVDLSKSELFLNKAASNNCDEALIYLGDLYQKQDNKEKATEFYNRALDAGVDGANERLIKLSQDQASESFQENVAENEVQNEEEPKPTENGIEVQNEEEQKPTENEVQNEEEQKQTENEVQNEEGQKQTENEVQNEEGQKQTENTKENEIVEEEEEQDSNEPEKPKARVIQMDEEQPLKGNENEEETPDKNEEESQPTNNSDTIPKKLDTEDEEEEEEEVIHNLALDITSQSNEEPTKSVKSRNVNLAKESSDAKEMCLLSVSNNNEEEEGEEAEHDEPIKNLYSTFEEKIKSLNDITNQPYKDVNTTLTDVQNQLIIAALTDCLNTYNKTNEALKKVEKEIDSYLNKSDEKASTNSSNLPSLKKQQKVTFVLDQPNSDSPVSFSDDEELNKLKADVQSLETKLNSIDQLIHHSKSATKSKNNNNSTKQSRFTSSPKELPALIKEPDAPKKSRAKNSSTLPTSSPRSVHNKIKSLQRRAEDGDPAAEYSLGAIYSIGEGVDQNKEKSFEFYKKSADKGFLKAQFAVASCYSYGRGTDVDKNKALEYYLMAAEQGYDKAQFAVGNFFDFGYGGVEQDHSKAVEWYRKAAEQGHQSAIEALKSESSEENALLVESPSNE